MAPDAAFGLIRATMRRARAFFRVTWRISPYASCSPFGGNCFVAEGVVVIARTLTVTLAAILAAGCMLARPAMGEQSLADIGRKQFLRCKACHALSAEAPPLEGPHLEGIVGRQVASVAGFDYSAALRAESFIWDAVQLDTWLQGPQALAPEMCMPFMGLAKPEHRAALIEYLRQPEP